MKKQKIANITRNYKNITTPVGYSLREDFSELYLSLPILLLSPC